jgi:hypothetical protein
MVCTWQTLQAQPDYPSAHWVPPTTCNKYYTSGNGHKFCVIHDMEGYYLSSVSYLNRCDKNTNNAYNVSASIHYCVNGLQDGLDEDGHGADDLDDAPMGDITQCVRDVNYAWHALCLNTWSYGTEHEGFVSSPIWYTDAMYQSSAALQRYLCNKSAIPKDRNHVVGHNEWQNAAWVAWMSTNYSTIDPSCNTHTDPGVFWNWTYFMSLINGGPGITNQPLGQVVQPGTSTSLTVTALGDAPLKYQWRKNGANLANATTTLLSLNNVTSNDAASYTVVVTNGAGSITSRIATLTVTPVWTTAFADDFETNSIGLWNFFWGAANGIADYTTNWAFDYSTNKYVLNGTTNNIPAAPGGAGTHGLKITVNKNDATASTVGVSLYPKGATYSGNYLLKCDAWINYNGALGGGTGSTEYGTFGINHANSRVNWSGATGSDGLWFAVDGEGQSGGTDYRAYAGAGAAAPTQLTFANSGLAANGAKLDHRSDPFFMRMFPEPAYENAGAPGKHWVQVEVIQLGNVITWQLNGVVFAQRTNTTSYTSGAPMIGYMDPFSSIANPPQDNFIIFDNVRVMVPAVAPAITAQPQPLSLKAGSNATFTVTATGTAPLAYQWRFNAGPIAGATLSTYTRTNVQAGDIGNYSVLITNVASSLVSSNASLNVIPIAPLQFQSSSLAGGTNLQLVLNGENATYQVWTSTNLNDWSFWTNVTVTNGTAVLLDDVQDPAQKFYRAVPAP